MNSKLKDRVLVVGKSGSGKTYFAKNLKKRGYWIICLDLIIQKNVMPIFEKRKKEELNDNIWSLFKLFDYKDTRKIIEEARDVFVRSVRKEMLGKRRVAVEGCLMNHQLIMDIFGDIDSFTVCFVYPKSKEVYLERIMNRFVRFPKQLGYLSFLKREGATEALDDYFKNGLLGEKISEFLTNIVQIEYTKISTEFLPFYISRYEVVIVNS